MACVYSDADKDPAPAQDKLILLWAQRTLELNLCKVEEGGRDGAENLYKYIIPWGTQCVHTNSSFPFKNNIHSWWKTAGLFQCVCWGGELCDGGQKHQGARVIVVRCSRTVTLLFSKLKKKKKRS